MLVVGLSVVMAVPAAAASEYYVATTGSNSNTGTSVSPWLTIGYAITHAPSGSTVSIAAGTYPEQLTITKPITLIGKGTSTVIAPTSVYSDASMYTYPGEVLSGVQLLPIVLVSGAVNVNIENLEVNGATAAAAVTTPLPLEGILYQNASGTIQGTTVQTVEPSVFWDPNYGDDIFVQSDGSLPSNVNIQNNTISKFESGGIFCIGQNTDCTITYNTVKGEGPNAKFFQWGVILSYGATGTVNNNHISENNYTGPGGSENYFSGWQSCGIMLWDASPSVSVSKNTVSLSDVGVVVISDIGTTPTSAYVVSNNTLLNNYGYGVVFDSVNGTSTDNCFQGNPVGMLVTDFSANALVTSINDQFMSNAINSEALDAALQTGSITTYSTQLVVQTSGPPYKPPKGPPKPHHPWAW